MRKSMFTRPSNNKLITVPSEIGLLTNVQELRLYRNEMVSLPEIGSLLQLQKLEMQHNEIEELFETIGLRRFEVFRYIVQ